MLPAPRRIGRFNLRGAWANYVKEVHRFFKVGFQTLVAPVITTLLFLAVFSLALGRAVTEINGVPFTQFLAPGLIMFAVIQNAFANTSSSMMISKIQGNIVDVLMSPLSPGELTAGFVLGGATRGVLVGLVVGLAMSVFVPVVVVDFGMVMLHAVAGSLMLSSLGLITAIWAEKFDHVA